MVGWCFFAALLGLAAVACDGNGRGPGDRSAAGSEPPAASAGRSWAGKDPSPPFPEGLTWFNVDRPLSLTGLHGKVILLDFWTLGCINCQHVIPDLQRLEAEFGDGLAVIGVHSGKYQTEHEDDAVREAVSRYGLHHAVVNDPDFVFWNRFGVSAWPTVVVVDPAGKLVGLHAGEGVYAVMQPVVASLLEEFESRGQIDRTPLPLRDDAVQPATVLSFPGAVLADEAGGRLFIADSGHNRVLVTGLDGDVRQAFGSGVAGFADGAAGEAAFRQPQGLALSADGRTLFVADTRNHAIRSVDLASGMVTTIAGTGAQLERLPVPGARARETALASPWGLFVAGDTLFVAMAGVHQLWAMDLHAGTIRVFAGTSREGIQDGDRLTQATLAQPSGLTGDDRYLYWVDPEASAVRRVPLAGQGEVETLVGTGLFDYGDADGPPGRAKLQHAQGISWGSGSLYLADTYNHKLKRVDPASFAVSTIAGGERGRADGAGTAARFDEPAAISVAGHRLYVADTNNHAIRVFDLARGSVSTLALTNLSAATGGGAGRPVRVSLPLQEVRAGAATIRVAVTAPPGYHLNSQAPARLTVTTSDPAVVAPGEAELTWSSDDQEVRFPVPADLATGEAVLTAAGAVYYCRTGEEALCFIVRLDVSLPLRVTDDARSGEIDFTVPLPAEGS